HFRWDVFAIEILENAKSKRPLSDGSLNNGVCTTEEDHYAASRARPLLTTSSLSVIPFSYDNKPKIFP
ncbi:unnamed protein product, partial [Amoebophrya sp. A120]